MKLTEQVAIVTGGGRGVGKQIALSLAGEGAKVALASPDADELVETASQIVDSGCQAIAILTDITDEAQVLAMVHQVHERFGTVDILVNNSGIAGPTASVADVERSDWDEVMAVNLTGAMLCAKAIIPDLIAKRSGKIVNISSIAGKIGYALRSPYAVSKWGLIGLSMALAKELAEDNVQVNAICPGPIDGPRMDRVFEDRARELEQSVAEVKEDYLNQMALHRLVRAEDIANLVTYLVSSSADNITGQAIDVSAGWGL